MRCVLSFLILLLSSCFCSAETILGHVVGIVDGDTITLLTPEKTQIKVRLYGIDAPEKKQAFGSRAKDNLSAIAFCKDAKLVTVNKDQYGRTVAWVYVANVNANEEQVRTGFAWWYSQFAKHETKLRDLEQEARKAKRGLWADQEPVPPWKWRQTSKARHRDNKSPRQTQAPG